MVWKPLVLLISFSFFACSSVEFVSSPERETRTEPSHSTKRHFFVFSLVGRNRPVFMDDVCLGKGVDQVRTVYHGDDIMAWIFTVGMYNPRTVEVWCRL